jgi:hypothetical protein
MFRFEKVIDATVNVQNVINFSADKERHVMGELQNTFVGRCFKGAYIVRIVSVRRTSAVHISRANSSAEGYVDVQFVAEVVAFNRWDVLTGIEVVNHQQMVVGKYSSPREEGEPAGSKPARAVVSILAFKNIETISVGQRIPVRVVVANHVPMQTHASVVGALLVCDQQAPAYRLRGSLDRAAAADLAPMLAQVEVELARRAGLIETRRADLWFFEKLLYAFRVADSADLSAEAWPGGPTWSGPGGVEPTPGAVSAVDIVRRAAAGESVPVAGVWSRSLAIYRSSPLVARLEGAQPTAVDSASKEAFAEFLKNILDFLVATREMVAVYNSRELIERHANIWGIMRAAQRPAPGPRAE